MQRGSFGLFPSLLEEKIIYQQIKQNNTLESIKDGAQEFSDNNNSSNDKTMSKFNDLINADQPILVDFFAEWCGPCKMMAPILKEVVSKVEGKAKIIKVDTEKNPAVASKYDVRSIPTLIIFKKGEIKWRQSGVVPADQLVDILKKFV